MSTSEKSSFWLVKFAPFRTSWAEIVKRGSFTLRGVRNMQARNHLAAMRLHDRVLFYRSQEDQALLGVMSVASEAFPDPTSADPRWLTREFRPVETLARPVTLAEIKADPNLAGIPLIRQPRLSVMPLTPEQFSRMARRQ